MRIYQILEEYSDENHPLTQQAIIDKLEANYGIECERKAVSRNLGCLQDMDFDVVITGKGAYLASRRFENSELRLLIDSVMGSRHINPNYSAELVGKLAELGGKNFKGQVKHIYTVGEWGKSDSKELFLNIDLIDEAIEKGKKISFDYMKLGVDKKQHKSSFKKATPYQLILHNQRYYLVMLDEKYNNMSYLRVEKMSKMKVLKEDGVPLREVEGYKNGIDYSRFASGFPYMFSDEQVTVRIKCKNRMADDLGDWLATATPSLLSTETTLLPPSPHQKRLCSTGRSNTTSTSKSCPLHPSATSSNPLWKPSSKHTANPPKTNLCLQKRRINLRFCKKI